MNKSISPPPLPINLLIVILERLLDKARLNEFNLEDTHDLNNVLEQLTIYKQFTNNYHVRGWFNNLLVLSNAQNFDKFGIVIDYLVNERLVRVTYSDEVKEVFLRVYPQISIENKVKISLYFSYCNVDVNLPLMDEPTSKSFIRHLISLNVDTSIESKIYKTYVKVVNCKQFERALAYIIHVCLKKNYRPQFTFELVEQLDMFDALKRYYHKLKECSNDNCIKVLKKIEPLVKSKRIREKVPKRLDHFIHLFYINDSYFEDCKMSIEVSEMT